MVRITSGATNRIRNQTTPKTRQLPDKSSGRHRSLNAFGRIKMYQFLRVGMVDVRLVSPRNILRASPVSHRYQSVPFPSSIPWNVTSRLLASSLQTKLPEGWVGEME